MGPLSADEIRRIVQAALAEDVGSGDVTTLATVPENAVARACMVAREPLVVAGLALAFSSLEVEQQFKLPVGEVGLPKAPAGVGLCLLAIALI